MTAVIWTVGAAGYLVLTAKFCQRVARTRKPVPESTSAFINRIPDAVAVYGGQPIEVYL